MIHLDDRPAPFIHIQIFNTDNLNPQLFFIVKVKREYITVVSAILDKLHSNGKYETRDSNIFDAHQLKKELDIIPDIEYIYNALLYTSSETYKLFFAMINNTTL